MIRQRQQCTCMTLRAADDLSCRHGNRCDQLEGKLNVLDRCNKILLGTIVDIGLRIIIPMDLAISLEI